MEVHDVYMAVGTAHLYGIRRDEKRDASGDNQTVGKILAINDVLHCEIV
jgi:hypothetical protein